MPTSRSPKRGAKLAPPRRSRLILPVALIIALSLLGVALVALPASILNRFLAPSVVAGDFSGSLWHGSAGTISANAHNLGAVEWRLNPWPLLHLTLSVDLHWVKLGFVADAAAQMNQHDLILTHVQAGGPIEDLSEFGIAQGWRGTSRFNFSTLKLSFVNESGRAPAATLTAAAGDLNVSNLASPQIAGGTDLGGYVLHVDGVAGATGMAAELNDTGGPLELTATIHFSTDTHTGLLSGTVRERPDASPALRSELNTLAQLHARDAQGRIPVELEFTL